MSDEQEAGKAKSATEGVVRSKFQNRRRSRGEFSDDCQPPILNFERTTLGQHVPPILSREAEWAQVVVVLSSPDEWHAQTIGTIGMGVGLEHHALF